VNDFLKAEYTVDEIDGHFDNFIRFYINGIPIFDAKGRTTVQ
jgi:hypothetical protein